jgi:hypothetical protein
LGFATAQGLGQSVLTKSRETTPSRLPVPVLPVGFWKSRPCVAWKTKLPSALLWRSGSEGSRCDSPGSVPAVLYFPFVAGLCEAGSLRDSPGLQTPATTDC